MAKNIVFGLLMLASAAFISGAASAAEPSLHEVYQAAEAGRLNEAQTMMREVLTAHPKSGKAHFVEAELLAKQGQLQKAETELATAEQLSPGLPFAKPQSVQNLRRQLGTSPRASSVDLPHVQAVQPAAESSMPWGMLFAGIGLIGFIVLAARFMAQRNPAPAFGGGALAGSGPGNISPSYGQPMQPYGAGGVSPMPAQGAGLGSRVMSGLATGAAVGAGVVAGEALMHHFMDGKESPAQQILPKDAGPLIQDNSLNDMGGADFGVSDTSSWDDSSSSGSDWN